VTGRPHHRRLLILVKHAEPVVEPDVPSNRWELSERGKDRCVALAERLRRYRPAAVVASEERKAAQTAGLVAERLGMPRRPFPVCTSTTAPAPHRDPSGVRTGRQRVLREPGRAGVGQGNCGGGPGTFRGRRGRCPRPAPVRRRGRGGARHGHHAVPLAVRGPRCVRVLEAARSAVLLRRRVAGLRAARGGHRHVEFRRGLPVTARKGRSLGGRRATVAPLRRVGAELRGVLREPRGVLCQ
jgi:histidine phosphatase superfamily protein (branch 1)